MISRHGIKQGVLVIDDSDHQRSKNTTHIAHVHRIKDKKDEGYFNGQKLIFLLLVTDKITFPVGFSFYEPDPALQEWADITVKQHKNLKCLKTQNLRDLMSEAELIFTALAELSTRQIAESTDTIGIEALPWKLNKSCLVRYYAQNCIFGKIVIEPPR